MEFFEILAINFFLGSWRSESNFEYFNEAVNDVIEEIFIKNSLELDLIVFGETSDKINEIIKKSSKLNGKTSLNIQHLNVSLTKSIKIEKSKIILTKNYQDAVVFFSRAKLANKTPKKLRFLIYVEENGDEIFDRIPLPVPCYRKVGNIQDFSYFLIEVKESLQLKTIEWFTEKYCNQSQVVTIDEFDKNLQKWKNSMIIPEKHKNAHKCLITIMLALPYDGDFNIYSKQYEGFIVDVVKVLAERGNFTFLFLPVGNHARWALKQSSTNVFFVPHTCFARLAMLMMAIDETVHTATTYDHASSYLVISPPEKLSNWEKVLRPFDYDTWKFLLITFAVAFLFVFIINRLPTIFKDLVYGEKVRLPAYNIIGTFFGIGQLRLPNGNFARIILMIFILFCLIIRTGYQGVFFEMLTTDIVSDYPKSIKELIRLNYTFLLVGTGENQNPSSYEPIFNYKRELLAGATIKWYGEIEELKEMFSNSTKSAALQESINLRMFPVTLELGGIQLKEEILTTPVAIGMMKNSFLLELLDEIVQRLNNGGILRFSHKLMVDMAYPPYEAPTKEPQVLSTDDLNFGFIIWLAAAGISSIFFFLEISLSSFLRKLENGIKKVLQNQLGIILLSTELKKIVKKIYP